MLHHQLTKRLTHPVESTLLVGLVKSIVGEIEPVDLQLAMCLCL